VPYEWDIKISEAPAQSGALLYGKGAPPSARLHIWPYRSLPRRSFASIIAGAFLLLLIPIFPLLGSSLLWGILPFAMGALALLWFFVEKSYRDGEILEELSLWPDRIYLSRTGPGRAFQEWEANPYWVRLTNHAHGGPVPDYLTLKGGGREVEIGAFLSEDERPALYDDLARALTLIKSRRAGP